MKFLGSTAMALLLAVAACSPAPPQTPEARADAARMAACRERNDEIYAIQNRGELYTDNSEIERSSPQSAGYVTGITSRGLSARFARDQQLASCLRQSQGGGQGAGQGAAPAGAGPALDPNVQ